MKISELNYRLSSIFGERIRLYELTNQDAKKYEKRYILREDEMFKENCIYFKNGRNHWAKNDNDLKIIAVLRKHFIAFKTKTLWKH